MIAEIGHYALYLALILSLAQASLPLVGAAQKDAIFLRSARYFALGQFSFIGLAFLCLLTVFAQSDFSVLLVAEHSHSREPLIYKLAGAWGNHEGSLLLWVLILAFFGALTALFQGKAHPKMHARALAIQGMIGAAFLVFLLFASNPFWRLAPAAQEGQELNPVLQDLSLAFHPPTLYLGYVGFSMTFSFAVAALLSKKATDHWIRLARPWMMLSWIALTAGIALGAHWAYYELGWGGYWFWDPVENASFMPWLSGTALLHASIATEKRGIFRNWSFLLAILTFGLSLLGTFLVRSGVLVSVHAFAEDPARGLIILGIIALVVGAALALFALRARQIQDRRASRPLSREGGLLLNTLLLGSATSCVFLGTLYPLALNIANGDILSVGAPFYALTFVPLMLPLIFLAGIGSSLAWQSADIKGQLRILSPALVFGFAVALTLMFFDPHQILAALGIGCAAWLIASIALQLAKRFPKNRKEWGTHLAHLGLAIVTIGIAASSAWKSEALATLVPGATQRLGRYEFRLDKVHRQAAGNYIADRADILITQDGKPVLSLHPERRHYLAQNVPTSETDIHSRLFSDLYATLGENDGKGAWVVRLYHQPMISWIWAGAAIMVLGGVLSFSLPRERK